MQPSSLETKSARILLGILFTPITIGIAFLSAVGLALGMITIQDGFRRDFMDDFVGGFLFLIIAPLPMVVIVGTWLRMLKKYEAMSKKMIKFVRGCLICGVGLSMVGFVVSLCFAIAILLHFIPAYRGAELELGILSILFLFVAYIFYFLLLKGTPKVHNSITRR